MRRVDLEAVIMAAVRESDPLIRELIRNSLRRSPPWRPRPGPVADGLPTDPRRPSSLSGGAAAALEFGA